MNELTPAQRDRVLRLVREGLSYRAVERPTGHRRETVSRYVRRHDAGRPDGHRRPRARTLDRAGATRESGGYAPAARRAR